MCESEDSPPLPPSPVVATTPAKPTTMAEESYNYHLQQQPKSPATVVASADGRCVSQGTQAGCRPKPQPQPHPPLLRHHASEVLLSLKTSRSAQQQLPNGRPASGPFYTSRSGHPYDFASVAAYGAAAARVRRRPQVGAAAADSPTSSLDYLPLRGPHDYAPDVVVHHQQMKQSAFDMFNVPLNGGGGGGSGASTHSCRCSCHGNNCNDNNNEAASPDTLSWRRLHMSRAKLKATATTSELLSGFAMIAMVELQINEPTNVPEWLFVMFAVCTTVLVAVHIFALMISTYLLPNIDAASKMNAGDVLRESPHERMRGFIELAWAFSTVLGLFLFLVEIAILCWVKFWDYSFAAATAATVIVIPVLIVFVAFAIHFYHSLVVHKYESSNEDIVQLETMKRNLDSATSNAGNSPV